MTLHDDEDRVRGLLSDAADLALTTGRTVELPAEGLAVVPDLLVIEGWASGVDPGTPWLLERFDGRSVAVYRLPDDEVDTDGPRCPDCRQRAPWGTYPPSLEGSDWFCNECLGERIRRACPECCEEREAA